MVVSFILLGLSVIFIAKGSDFLTDSLVPLARRLQTSSISLGLILVSLSVSLPEVFVAVSSGFKGSADLALGVVLGSIICNIALMTGLSATVKPLHVTTHMVLRDGIFSIVIPVLVLAISSDGEISRLEGFSILLLFVPYLANVFLQEKRITFEEKEVLKSHTALRLSLIGLQVFKMVPGFKAFVFGLGLLLLGSQMFSDQLIQLVKLINLPEIVIGVTIGAIGTSIPNIVSAYQATRKGLTEVAVSETLGSNIFTLLVTLGILAIAKPTMVSSQWLSKDIPLLILMSFLLFIFMLTKKTISRKEGYILLGIYIFIVFSQIVFSAS